MPEAHAGQDMDRSLISDPADSYAASDDYVGGIIRERLVEYRGITISFLQEKVTLQFIQSLLNIQLITPGESDQLRKKQKRSSKASSLVDIISKKRGTDLKVFVDQLKTQCPKAHNILHVSEFDRSFDSQNTNHFSSNSWSASNGNNSRNGMPPKNHNGSKVMHQERVAANVNQIERSMRKASDKLEKYLKNTHYGIYMFLRVLKGILSSNVDIALVTFANGNSVMHEVILQGKCEYLTAIQYSGCWSKLFNVRTDTGAAGVTPSELAVRLKRTKLMAVLSQVNAFEIALHDVCQCVRAGNVALFRELLQMNRQYVVQNCGNLPDRPSLLEYACQSGLLAMVFEVIKTEKELGVGRCSIDKAMALCVELGHHMLLQPLLDYVSTNINSIIVDGKSLIERSAINGDLDTYLELERIGMQPSDTIVALAAAQNRLPFLEEVLSTSRLSHNINFQDRRQKSAMHFAAEKGNFEVVRLLLAKGADLTLKDKRDFSILHSAVNGGDLPTVLAIIDAYKQNSLLESVLSSRDRYLGSERCFLVRGRDKEHPAWHYVEADRGRIDVFRRRTQGGAVDVAAYGTVLKSGWGMAPPPAIVQEVEGMYDIVNTRSDTPLDQQPIHVAISKNHEAVSLKLISIMDDVGEPDRFHLTPLHLAAMRGNVKVINALIKKGANENAIDIKGRTPLGIAKANDHPDAIAALMHEEDHDGTEDLRRKVLHTYHALARHELDQCKVRGRDPKLQTKMLLRDMIADINDFLYDSLGEGPIAVETFVMSSHSLDFQ